MPSSIIFVRSCPARPTNGTPCASSSAPGASPTNMIRAAGDPSAKTVCLRVLHRRHVTQEETFFAKDSRTKADAFPVDVVAAGYGAFSSKVNRAVGAAGVAGAEPAAAFLPALF